jgi:uncharacterized protein involved in outer membrane biogenesis
MHAAARGIQVKRLFPTMEKMQATVGAINGDAQLSAVGNSVAALLGKANGEVKTTIEHGSISKLLLEEMGLNVGSIVLTLRPQTKGLRILSLRAPLYVKGPFSQPRVSVDKTVLALKGAAALLLAVIAPPLEAIVPLTQQQADKHADCASLLAATSVKPVAPPPGRRAPCKLVLH